mmetsp:Transcript_35391/g.111829  ORF Transcript_35391/g.111829 Transcript_35391/m.111829 type:complete len:116 (-) Transcript_35391:244-591(-)
MKAPVVVKILVAAKAVTSSVQQITKVVTQIRAVSQIKVDTNKVAVSLTKVVVIRNQHNRHSRHHQWQSLILILMMIFRSRLEFYLRHAFEVLLINTYQALNLRAFLSQRNLVDRI